MSFSSPSRDNTERERSWASSRPAAVDTLRPANAHVDNPGSGWLAGQPTPIRKHVAVLRTPTAQESNYVTQIRTA